MKNYLQLEINGQKYGLKFNVGTLNHVKEIAGVDPFKFRAASDEFEDVMAYARVVFVAALRSGGFTDTVEAANLLFNDLSATDIQLIVSMYNNPTDSKPSVNGEVAQNTQPGTDLG